MLDPHYFGHNYHVTSLDMSFNQMFDFPPDGSPFLFHSDLRHYYCKFCGITAIYEMTFSKLNQLELLNLRGNRIKTIPVTAFNYNRINYLYLAYNQIQSFNKMHELETMQHLVKLDLSGNEGFQLYNLTIDFSALERVICERCELNSLSQKWFEQVKRLKKLNLENNLIYEVPKMCFSKNHRLNYINLSGNRIKSLDIVNDRLEVLICNNCGVEEVREVSFQGMPNLNVLELNHNQITNVEPTAFTSNELLKHLSLDHNNLTDFPYNVLRTSQSLESLCLDYNPFYPQKENCFKNLYKAMNLRKNCSSGHNPLYHFENFIPDVAPAGLFLYTKDFPSCHEAVDISSRNVVFIHPMAYENCSQFRILQMDKNFNFTFPKHRPFLYSEFLESYSCCQCAIDALYPETFTKLPRLKSILLKYNHLHRITSLDILTSLHSLQSVDLTHNLLELLPVELLSSHKLLANIDLSNNQDLWHRWNLPILEQPSATRLHALHCGINKITQATFSLMPSLEELDISYNPIEIIDSRAFEKHSRLRILYLKCTHLRVMPFEVIAPLVQLKRFCLHGSDLYDIEEDRFKENNARLGASIRKRKLYCAEDEIFLERLSETAYSNGSARLERGVALSDVVISYIISRLVLHSRYVLFRVTSTHLL
ncbi:leucine-rich repeat-containing G-protein coupled receptor 5-like [Ochlerotatus camptorhynchus]|uniref:leucine-rich repeat-containing G-protein coupled receptor 5-like n=1 Tax=Ochlerotatus camptorhynchus TaxID=644619 RepID=UPI0031DFA641